VTRILIDTSVYVDWFRSRRHEDIIAGRRGTPSLSAVVAMELLTGERKRNRIEAWAAKYHSSGRLLVPGWEVWSLAGRVLRRLREHGTGGQALTNDVLIAMTGRRAGMKVFTANGRAFTRIAAVEPFELEIVT
jgi:predicted nucleic acid-binding protein